LSLQLQKRNGLYYTPISTLGVDSSDPALTPSANFSIFYHTQLCVDNDEISLDFEDVSIRYSLPPEVPSMNRQCNQPPPKVPLLNPQCCPPFSIPTPKSSPTSIEDFIPKAKQIEADLWQARLGHCSDWQLKVIPMSADGLPSWFHPHPFASYDHYNQARIRK
jgi:hypothetical protein